MTHKTVVSISPLVHRATKVTLSLAYNTPTVVKHVKQIAISPTVQFLKPKQCHQRYTVAAAHTQKAVMSGATTCLAFRN